MIYEVDDDNYPVDDLHGFHFTTPVSALTICTSNLTYNPYVHFGQSTLWPRGYPLELIGQATPRNYVLHKSHVAPIVQQGLVSADPDVDAIFRLTRKNSAVKMDISFDSQAPPVILPLGTFAPLNSQNTLYRYRSFWALVLPVTTTFRTCDIYRSYWAQRLMWLIGGQVGFYPPNIQHQRNEHDYIADAKAETDFLRMGELVAALKEWQCTRMHFFSCISDLARFMVSKKFWQQLDVDVIDAWLQDLSALGYMAPTLKETEPTPCTASGERRQDVTFYPVEQYTTLPHSTYSFLPHQVRTDRQLDQVLHLTCGRHPTPSSSALTAATQVFRDTLLVINFRSAAETLPLLEAWYRAHFANVLYCMTAVHQKHIPKDLLHRWRVSAVLVANNGGPASCLSAAVRIGYNVTGYLYIPDTVLLHPSQLKTYSPAHMWMTKELAVNDPHLQSMCRAGTVKCASFSKDVLASLSAHLPRLDLGSKFKTKLKQCFNKMSANPRLSSSMFYLTDVVHYLPTRLTNIFAQIADVYLSEPSVVKEYEVVALMMLECIETAPAYLNYGAISNSLEHLDYTFPFPMSKVTQKELDYVKYYCEEI